jgi:hypothetical protein
MTCASNERHVYDSGVHIIIDCVIKVNSKLEAIAFLTKHEAGNQGNNEWKSAFQLPLTNRLIY